MLHVTPKRAVNSSLSKCTLHLSSFQQNYNPKMLALWKILTHYFPTKITLTFPVILGLWG